MNYQLKTIPVGFLDTNCYMLISGDGIVVIDPGDEADKIVAALPAGRSPDALLVTHAHADHIAAVEEIKKKFPQAVIMAHSLEFPALGDPSRNLSFLEGMRVRVPNADKALEDSQIITAGKDIKLKVIHTPGHTAGSLCFFDEGNKIVFTGDTIFKETVGRVDLPGGSEESMMKSLSRFASIADKMGDLLQIYPGHGPSTTFGWEKKHNPYLAGCGRL